MNLPKGPDTLCFDKDEFMKVRAGARLPGPGRAWPALAAPPPRASLGLLPSAPRAPPPGPALGGDLAALRSEPLGLRCVGAARSRRLCEIVHMQRKGLKVQGEWF